jgi:hypothetical protein
MATNVETMWVTSQEQLDATVQTLLAQGGQVQGQGDGEVQVYLKKKMNVIVLVVGLLLCLVPGLVYLLWYSTADQNQQITVKIGGPTSIHTEHEHWYDQQAVDGASRHRATYAPATAQRRARTGPGAPPRRPACLRPCPPTSRPAPVTLTLTPPAHPLPPTGTAHHLTRASDTVAGEPARIGLGTRGPGRPAAAASGRHGRGKPSRPASTWTPAEFRNPAIIR